MQLIIKLIIKSKAISAMPSIVDINRCIQAVSVLNLETSGGDGTLSFEMQDTPHREICYATEKLINFNVLVIYLRSI